MKVSVEISYSPLVDNFSEPIKKFLAFLEGQPFQTQIGTMSTLIVGDFNEIMAFLTQTMTTLMEQYPSIFQIKISNSCI